MKSNNTWDYSQLFNGFNWLARIFYKDVECGYITLFLCNRCNKYTKMYLEYVLHNLENLYPEFYKKVQDRNIETRGESYEYDPYTPFEADEVELRKELLTLIINTIKTRI